MKIEMHIMKWQRYLGITQYFPFEDFYSFHEIDYTIEVEISARRMERHILNDTLDDYKKGLFSTYLAERRAAQSQRDVETFRKYIGG